jgi:hypothetical protein
MRLALEWVDVQGVRAGAATRLAGPVLEVNLDDLRALVEADARLLRVRLDSLVGAVPVEQYRLLIDWMLAGEPGGLIPLDFSDPATSAAGQSPVGQAHAT